MRINNVVRWCIAGAITCAAVVGLVSAPASAQTSNDPSPPLVTDYANYPLGLGIIPAGCTTLGRAVLVNPQFSVDGGPATDSLQSLDLQPPAAEVSLTWDGFAAGCEGIGVSLSGKISGTPYFDPSYNQEKDRSAYCGPGDGLIPCAAPYRLSLRLDEQPGQIDPPCFQIDAHLGPALAIVGPAGSFYRNNNAGRADMLIDAWNGGRQPCTQPPPVTVTTLSPTTTTTTPPPPTTGEVTTTSVSPISVSTSRPAVTSTTCPAGSAMDNDSCVQVAGISATIPRTGTTSGATAGAGVFMVLLGSVLVVAAGTLGRHRRHS